jgi:hypothetical protein
LRDSKISKFGALKIVFIKKKVDDKIFSIMFIALYFILDFYIKKVWFFLAVEVLDSLMGCDLGNVCAKAERLTSEKSVNENVDYFQIQTLANMTHSS